MTPATPKAAPKAEADATLAGQLDQPHAFTDWVSVGAGRFFVSVTPTRPDGPFNVMLERSEDHGRTKHCVRVFFRDTEAAFHELSGALYRFRALATLNQPVKVRLRR